MAIIMEYRSGSSRIIVCDDYIEDMEKQQQLLHRASSIVIREDYRRYLEERKMAMEGSRKEVENEK